MGKKETIVEQNYDAVGPSWTQPMYKGMARPQYGEAQYGDPTTMGQRLQQSGNPLLSFAGRTFGNQGALGKEFRPITGYDYSGYQLDPSQYQIGGFEQLRGMYNPVSAQMIGASNIGVGQMATPDQIRAQMVGAGQMTAPGEVNYQTEGDVRNYLEQAAAQAGGGELGQTTNEYLMNLMRGGGAGDYDAYRNSMLQDYQRNVAPQITESLAARGMLRGSGAREAAEQSSIDVANQLDQARYAREMGAEQLRLQAAGMGGQLGSQQFGNLLGVAQGYGALGGQLAGIDQQNVANQMGQQQFNIGSRLQADLANQQANYNQQSQNIANLMGQQQFNIGTQFDADRSNQMAQLQAAMSNQGAGLQAGLANQQARMSAGQFDIASEMARQYQNQATQLGVDQYNVQMPVQMQQMDFANRMAAGAAAAGEYRPTEQITTEPFNFANDILGPVLGAGGNILGSALGGGYFGGGGGGGYQSMPAASQMTNPYLGHGGAPYGAYMPAPGMPYTPQQPYGLGGYGRGPTLY